MPTAGVTDARKSSPPRYLFHNSAAANDMASSSALPQPEGSSTGAGAGAGPGPTFRGRPSSRTLSDLKASSLNTPSPLPRRRSSILSFSSLDDTRHSAGDFIRPGLGLDRDENTEVD